MPQKLSKEERVNKVKSLSISKHELSPQAKKIIEAIDDFNPDHFNAWMQKRKGHIHGTHLHEYLSVEDGFQDSQR